MKYLIFVFVMVFDPLAICLIIATSSAVKWREEEMGSTAAWDFSFKKLGGFKETLMPGSHSTNDVSGNHAVHGEHTEAPVPQKNNDVPDHSSQPQQSPPPNTFKVSDVMPSDHQTELKTREDISQASDFSGGDQSSAHDEDFEVSMSYDEVPDPQALKKSS